MPVLLINPDNIQPFFSPCCLFFSNYLLMSKIFRTFALAKIFSQRTPPNTSKITVLHKGGIG